VDDESITPLEVTGDREIRQMLGLFDVPAFARRGQELEHSLKRLRERLQARRLEMLDIVRLRLRQWCAVAAGPEDAAVVFEGPIESLWALTGAEPGPWSDRPSSQRRQRIVARDLIASIERFNVRWGRLLRELKLDGVNQAIEHYNRYYVLEKECILGSVRLAARYFVPRERVSPELLLAEFPPLPVPRLR
jgi:hypothetical protein